MLTDNGCRCNCWWGLRHQGINYTVTWLRCDILQDLGNIVLFLSYFIRHCLTNSRYLDSGIALDRWIRSLDCSLVLYGYKPWMLRIYMPPNILYVLAKLQWSQSGTSAGTPQTFNRNYPFLAKLITVLKPNANIPTSFCISTDKQVWPANTYREKSLLIFAICLRLYPKRPGQHTIKKRKKDTHT